MPPEVDFDRLLASLKDLSELVVGSDTQVTPMPGGAQFHDLEPIPVKLYRNGMVIFDGPFRSFHDPATQVRRVGGREDSPLVLPTLFIISWRWGPVYPLWALSPMQNLQSPHPHLCQVLGQSMTHWVSLRPSPYLSSPPYRAASETYWTASSLQSSSACTLMGSPLR